MKKDYSDLLRDPRWQKKRLEILQRDDFTCQECGSETETLHVHHLYYVSRRMPWDYPDFVYETVCKECHEFVQAEEIPFWEVICGEVMAGGEAEGGCLACSLSGMRINGFDPAQVIGAMAFWLTTANGVKFVQDYNRDAKTASYYTELREAHGGLVVEV